MTGRGIDQVLPYPNAPGIYEPYMKSAEGYVTLAERVSGPIPKPVDFSYVWGDAMDELERAGPDLRIINLETAVTKSEDYEDKGINYRMHPDNIPCITAAKIDCCSLANNHILDWGYAGLIETLETGYEVSKEQRAFAHGLIDIAGVDLIHGHSSHHVKGIEVYKGKLILYGCGDFITDYEGISGYEDFKADLGLMYFASISPSTGILASLQMTQTRMKRLRVNLASRTDSLWLRDVLNREGKRFGTHAQLTKENTLTLRWNCCYCMVFLDGYENMCSNLRKNPNPLSLFTIPR